jgi:hypothetical protein
MRPAGFCYGIIALFCLTYAGMALAGPNIREGLWEITVRMEMAGKPANEIPPATQTLCLTDKNKLPELLQKDQDCQITDAKTQGSEASWKMKCRDNLITGSGKITYKGDRFDGIIHIRMQQDDAEPMKAKPHVYQLMQRIEGRRTGECP